MNILCTGDQGFLGKYVRKSLEKKKHKVFGYDKARDECEDLLCIDKDDLKANKIKAVIHLAGMVGLRDCYENPKEAILNNAYATANLLEACQDYGKLEHIIHASTWAVDGNLENPYDISKLCAEHIARFYHKQNDLPISIFRLGTLYGPGMNPAGVIPAFIKKIEEGKPLIIYGDGNQERQFTYVNDVAEAFVKGLKKADIGETYNIASPKATTINHITYLLNLMDDTCYKIKHKKARNGDEDYKQIYSREALLDFGWEAKTSLEEGIRRMRE